MFDFIIFISFLIFFFFLSVSIIKTKIKNNELLEKLLEANIDKALIANRLETELVKSPNSEQPEQEGFINFLNQSRDWAFEYIELVQSKIKEFEKEIDPIIKNVESHNDVDFKVSTLQMIESSRNLIKLLPEGENR
jgi:hypothetical protein